MELITSDFLKTAKVIYEGVNITLKNIDDDSEQVLKEIDKLIDWVKEEKFEVEVDRIGENIAVDSDRLDVNIKVTDEASIIDTVIKDIMNWIPVPTTIYPKKVPKGHSPKDYPIKLKFDVNNKTKNSATLRFYWYNP